MSEREGAGRGGRRRRFDDETERQMLLDAALRVMRRKVSDGADGAVSVNDVLEEASLTTRAFYRHFGSKDALAETLLLRDVEAIAASLARSASSAADPAAAVEAWVDGLIAVIFDAKRSRRAGQITRVADDRHRGPSVRLLQQMRDAVCEPLVGVLRRGHAAGELHSPTPEADAFSVYELVLQFRDAAGVGASAAAAKAHVVRFAWPALGLRVR